MKSRRFLRFVGFCVISIRAVKFRRYEMQRCAILQIPRVQLNVGIYLFASVKCNRRWQDTYTHKNMFISKKYVISMNAHKYFHHGINYVNAANPSIPQKPTALKPISSKNLQNANLYPAKTDKTQKPTGFHS